MSTRINTILQQAYEYVSEDEAFLRLTTIGTIIHSMIFIVIVGYNISQIVANYNTQFAGVFTTELARAIQDITHIDGIIPILIIIAVVLAVGYFIFPPIGEAAMIYHLEKSFNNKTGSSVSHGLKKFFPMFERNSLIGFLSIATWLTLLARLIILDVLGEPLIMPIIIIYTLIVIAVGLLTPYVKFKLVVENEKFFNAVKESMLLAISHPMMTLRLTAVSIMLNLRIVFNLIIIVGVPSAIFYVAYLFDLHTAPEFLIILGIIVAVLFVLIAYINCIIDAFFMTYWYLGYRSIEVKE